MPKLKTIMSIQNFPFLLALLLFVACTEEKKEEVEVIRPVRSEKVKKMGSATTNSFSGLAQSSKTTPLSFKVAGTLNKVYVQVGERVKRGQRLARIDATDYQVDADRSLANLRSTETQIASAESQLYTTKAAYQRLEKLYENNSVPLSDYEQARGQYEAAQAQLAAANAQATAAKKQLEGANNQVGYANLNAAFDGIITEVNVEENEMVNSGKTIVMLSSFGDPEIKVGLPELYIAQIEKGQIVTIHFSILPDQSFQGKVKEVGFSTIGGTYPVTVEIIDPSKTVRPGMAANVTFNFSGKPTTEQQIIVSAKAVGEDQNGNFVFVLKPTSDYYIAQRQTVIIGELTENGFVVKSGLDEGTLVATAGLRSLLDGMKVSIQK